MGGCLKADDLAAAKIARLYASFEMRRDSVRGAASRLVNERLSVSKCPANRFKTISVRLCSTAALVCVCVRERERERI